MLNTAVNATDDHHMRIVPRTLSKTFDLDTVLFQLGVGLDEVIQPDAREPCRQAVLDAEDDDAPELRNWIADNLVRPNYTGAVGRDCIARYWISYVLADAAKKNGESAAAWYYVSKARFHEGQIVAEIAASQRIDRMMAGRRGGQKTGAARSPLIRECIHLLGTRRPDDGWRSHEHAFESICAELIDFSDRSGEPLTRDVLSLKVMDWLAKRPDVRDAYAGKKNGQP